jgi:hypothetical protein
MEKVQRTLPCKENSVRVFSTHKAKSPLRFATLGENDGPTRAEQGIDRMMRGNRSVCG